MAMPPAWSHDEHGPPGSTSPEKLGEVNFPVNCNAEAQKEFNRAMALAHSFWFNPAINWFGTVLRHDTTCAMAYWGVALMSLGNPFTWPPGPKAWNAGAIALAHARRIPAHTEREQDYIAALAVLFNDWETTDYRPRVLAYEKAMEGVAARYPSDTEAQILYALALDATALPTDKTFANQLKAANILEPLFRKYPNHPGVAHYLIHTYDYAELAEKGLPAARAYAAIAPSVPHALHMPSHIFSRAGLWREMVASNQASYQAAKGELKEANLGVGAYDALHAMDYMVFAHLQQAQDKAARRLVEEAGSIRKLNVENFPAAYAFAAIPSRYALERSDWKGAAALELLPAELAWDKFPQAEAILVFARGLGAARSGDNAAARRDMQRLQALKERDDHSQAGLLGRADRFSNPDDRCVACPCGEPRRRSGTADARRRGSGRSERQAPGDARQCRSLARTAGGNAASAQSSRGGVCRVRALPEARPQPLPQHCRRGPRGGGVRQPHGRPQLLCKASSSCGRS